MDNFDDFENKSYVKAGKVDYKFSDNLKFLLKATKTIIQIYLVLIFDIFVKLLNVFSPAKPKNISGQLALVTGEGKLIIVMTCVVLVECSKAVPMD